MTFVTKRIEPTPTGLHVRYFAPNDPPDVHRSGDVAWANVVAVTGSRLQFEKDGPAFRELDVFQDDGTLETFVDAPFVEGWLDMADAIRSRLESQTRQWFERLASLEPHPLWKSGCDRRKRLLIYQRDDQLPDVLTAKCEFCDRPDDLIV